MAKNSMFDTEANDQTDELLKRAAKKAVENNVKQVQETGGLRKRTTYSDDEIRDPLSLVGHEALSYTGMDYMQKNGKVTNLIMSPFAKVTAMSRAKLSDVTATFSQQTSREFDQYMSILGFTFLVEHFGAERALERFTRTEVERILSATNDIQNQMTRAQMAIQEVLLSNAGQLNENDARVKRNDDEKDKK
ncbi:hypothetical protein CTM97_15600 [Photobacterium phosphoreum]|uniref:Uncharacterized protein n=2 Tax=Photobacterium phosphoreum TaxID=659 RepID=A0A2T3JT27_PHOPO|nr:hypothetical protein [Photobacterium phosphoreum]PSU40430.1 hypothetical protein CTM97_15600 [Photobacterium phosphoreum]PSU52297.1 hypothetical protein C9J18_09130 [Photobacterium phosphoreum]